MLVKEKSHDTVGEAEKEKRDRSLYTHRWGGSEYDLLFEILTVTSSRVFMFRSVENRYPDICLGEKSVPNLSWMMVSLPQGPDLPFPGRNLRSSQIFLSPHPSYSLCVHTARRDVDVKNHAQLEETGRSGLEWEVKTCCWVEKAWTANQWIIAWFWECH